MVTGVLAMVFDGVQILVTAVGLVSAPFSKR